MEFLKSIESFKKYNIQNVFQNLVSSIKYKIYAKDEIILDQSYIQQYALFNIYIKKIDFNTHNIYILYSGQVGCYLNENCLVKTLKEGDTFGELAVVFNKACKVSYVAQSICQIYYIPRQDVPPLIKSIEREINQKLNNQTFYNSPIFNEWDQGSLSFLNYLSEVQEYMVGQYVYQKNQQPEGVYLVISGSFTVSEFTTGQIFGEQEVLQDKLRKFDVKSETNIGKLLFINTQIFINYVYSNPSTQDLIKSKLQKRNIFLTKQIENIQTNFEGFNNFLFGQNSNRTPKMYLQTENNMRDQKEINSKTNEYYIQQQQQQNNTSFFQKNASLQPIRNRDQSNENSFRKENKELFQLIISKNVRKNNRHKIKLNMLQSQNKPGKLANPDINYNNQRELYHQNFLKLMKENSFSNENNKYIQMNYKHLLNLNMSQANMVQKNSLSNRNLIKSNVSLFDKTKLGNKSEENFSKKNHKIISTESTDQNNSFDLYQNLNNQFKQVIKAYKSILNANQLSLKQDLKEKQYQINKQSFKELLIQKKQDNSFQKKLMNTKIQMFIQKQKENLQNNINKNDNQVKTEQDEPEITKKKQKIHFQLNLTQRLTNIKDSKNTQYLSQSSSKISRKVQVLAYNFTKPQYQSNNNSNGKDLIEKIQKKVGQVEKNSQFFNYMFPEKN